MYLIIVFYLHFQNVLNKEPKSFLPVPAMSMFSIYFSSVPQDVKFHAIFQACTKLNSQILIGLQALRQNAEKGVNHDIIVIQTASEWVTALTFVPCTHQSGLRHIVVCEGSLSLLTGWKNGIKTGSHINISLLKPSRGTHRALCKGIYQSGTFWAFIACQLTVTGSSAASEVLEKETWLTVWSAVPKPQLKVSCCGYGRHI